MKYRDFAYKGIKFHLNDNWNGANREFEGKYDVVFYHEGYERWMSLFKADTKAEAEHTVRMFYKEKRHPYTER